MVKVYSVLTGENSLEGITLENIFIHRDDQLFPLLSSMPRGTAIGIAYETHRDGIYNCYCAKLAGGCSYDSRRRGIEIVHINYSEDCGAIQHAIQEKKSEIARLRRRRHCVYKSLFPEHDFTSQDLRQLGRDVRALAADLERRRADRILETVADRHPDILIVRSDYAEYLHGRNALQDSTVTAMLLETFVSGGKARIKATFS